jgi:predicted glutamine amidotransferase
MSESRPVKDCLYWDEIFEACLCTTHSICDCEKEQYGCEYYIKKEEQNDQSSLRKEGEKGLS